MFYWRHFDAFKASTIMSHQSYGKHGALVLTTIATVVCVCVKKDIKIVSDPQKTSLVFEAAFPFY